MHLIHKGISVQPYKKDPSPSFAVRGGRCPIAPPPGSSLVPSVGGPYSGPRKPTAGQHPLNQRGSLKRSARAVQLFARLAVLETHTLRY